VMVVVAGVESKTSENSSAAPQARQAPKSSSLLGP
jgi:hypothetical protein